MASLNPLAMLSVHGSYSTDSFTLHVYNGLTGAKITAPLTLFNNIEALKLYLTQTFKIDMESLFLLTPYGIKLKFSMLLNNETTSIYAFDRKFFSPSIVNADDMNDKHLKSLLSPLIENSPISMIKPRQCPLISIKMNEWINDLSQIVNDSKEVSSSDLDFDGLRLILNSLKRTSGWSSALLSDFKSSIFKSSNDGQMDINNMLESLNVLNQYVNLLFKKLEKEFNDSIDIFSTLSENSLSDSWKGHYNSLQMLNFYARNNGKIESIQLSTLIDEFHMNECSQQSKYLNSSINQSLVNLKDLIDHNIVSQIEFTNDKYEEYKKRYLNSQRKSNSNQLTNKCKDLFNNLESQVNLLHNEIKNLPSFPELIVTTSPNTTVISQDSVSKLKNLIQIYNIQINERVPIITSLVDDLYETQINGLSDKGELQKDIITSFFVSIVKIQLSIRKLTKMVHSEVRKPLNLLKEMELSLSTVSDLPLVFGIWVIAILSNLKHGMSIDKLIKKTGEILEMLNYVESSNQSKWLDNFINGIGKDKVEILGLNDIDLKLKFSKGLFNKSQFKIINNINIEQDLKLGDVNLLTKDKRLSFDMHYLQPLNKIIQNINVNAFHPQQHQPTSQQELDYEPNDNKYTTLTSPDEIKIQKFFSLMIKSVTLSDIFRYINDLHSIGIEKDITNQLNQYIKNLGASSFQADEKSTLNENGEILIKNGDINGFGTFDSNDGMFLNVFKKFLKGFEIDGILIDVTNRQNVIEDVDKFKDEVQEGYEIRIKKLENLLHEKKFEEFNDRWSKKGVKLIDLGELNTKGDLDLTNTNGIALGKFMNLPPDHYTETFRKLNETNERLTQELNELKESKEMKENETLKDQLESKDEEINELKFQLEKYKTQVQTRDEIILELEDNLQTQNDELNKFKSKKLVSNDEIDEMKDINRDLIANMSHKEEEFQRENKLNQNEKNELKHQVDDLFENILLLTELNDKLTIEFKNILNSMKEICQIFEFMNHNSKDLSSIVFNNFKTTCLLLENMGLIVLKDSKSSKHDIDSGESILDETAEYNDTNTNLNKFSFTSNDKLTVNRVKGLRNKKKEILISKVENGSSENIDMDQVIFQLVSKDIIDESQKRIDWFPPDIEFELADKMIGSFEEITSSNVSEQICEHVKQTDDFFEFLKEENLKIMNWISKVKFDEVKANYESFTNIVNLNNKLVIEKAHKRFDDVESLARKLTKEKNQLKVDIKELKTNLKNRLVLRNFNIGDLVLFLKAVIPIGKRLKTPLIDSDASYSLENSEDISLMGIESIPSSSGNGNGDNDSTKQSWAIFNIGSPNYYLKNQDKTSLKNRDWFVGRITKLEEHIVTEENVNNVKKNPFRLDIESKWYYVITDEEKISG